MTVYCFDGNTLVADSCVSFRDTNGESTVRQYGALKLYKPIGDLRYKGSRVVAFAGAGHEDTVLALVDDLMVAGDLEENIKRVGKQKMASSAAISVLVDQGAEFSGKRFVLYAYHPSSAHVALMEADHQSAGSGSDTAYNLMTNHGLTAPEAAYVTCFLNSACNLPLFSISMSDPNFLIQEYCFSDSEKETIANKLKEMIFKPTSL